MSDLVTYSKSLITDTSVPLIDYLYKSWTLENTYLNQEALQLSSATVEIVSSPTSIQLSPVTEITASVPCLAAIDQISKYSKYLTTWNFSKGIYNFCSMLNLPVSLYTKDIETAMLVLRTHTHTSLLSELLFLEESGLLLEKEAPAVGSYLVNTLPSDTDLGVTRNEHLDLVTGTMWSVSLFFRFTEPLNEGNLVYVPGQFRAYVGASAELTVDVFDVGTVSETCTATGTEYNQLEISRFDNVYKIFLNGQCLAVFKKLYALEISDMYIGYYLHPSDSLSSTTFEGLFRNVQVYAGFPNYYQYTYFSPVDSSSSDTELHYTFFIGEEDRVADVARTYTSDISTEPFLASGMLNEFTHFELAGTPVEVQGDFTIEAEVLNTSGNTRGTIALYGEEAEFNWHLGVYDSKARFQIGGVTLESTTNVSTSDLTLITAERDGTTVNLYVNGALEDSNTYSGDTISFAGKTLRIKRKEDQASTIASTNSTLYPSKSRIFIRSLRYTSTARFQGSYAPIKGLIYG